MVLTVLNVPSSLDQSRAESTLTKQRETKAEFSLSWYQFGVSVPDLGFRIRDFKFRVSDSGF